MTQLHNILSLTVHLNASYVSDSILMLTTVGCYHCCVISQAPARPQAKLWNSSPHVVVVPFSFLFLGNLCKILGNP